MFASEGILEEHVFDLLPGYALGSLDEEELLQVARHLPVCAACRQELSTYWDAVDELVLSMPLRTPPPGLKNKVLRRVAPAAKPAVRSQSARPVRRWFTWPLGLSLGALALVIILVLGLSNLLLWRQVTELQTRVPDAHMQLVRLGGTPEAAETRGYLMVFKNETYGTLVVENAPQLDPEHQYQLWLIRDGKRTSGGVFSVDKDGYGTLQVWAKQPLDSFPSFGVTVEPAGGSPGPTGQKVLGGEQ